MDVKQQAINYAALAREQINEQIKLNRELIDQTREQIKGLIQQQVTEAKEEQLKLAKEARMSAQEDINSAQQEMNKEAYAHAQLMKSIEMLSEGTGVNQEEVAKQVIEATETASKIVEQISQVFNPVKPQEVLDEKLEEKPEEKETVEVNKNNNENPQE